MCLTRADEKNDPKRESFHLDAKLSKFSHAVQHRVLGTIQQILETSCYDFTCTWFPSVLADRAWSCAAALELTKWLHIMNDRVDTLPNSCVDEKGRAVFKEIRPRLALLRHTAVHRLHLEHSAFLEQIHAALMLTEILRDDSSKSKLQAVYTRLEETILETGRSTEAVQQDVSHKLLALQEQRHELDRREQQLRASAAKQFVRISKEANRFLMGCVDNLLDANKLENESGKDIQRGSSEICVDENDIESDEDQLQADLK